MSTDEYGLVVSFNPKSGNGTIKPCDEHQQPLKREQTVSFCFADNRFTSEEREGQEFYQFNSSPPYHRSLKEVPEPKHGDLVIFDRMSAGNGRFGRKCPDRARSWAYKADWHRDMQGVEHEAEATLEQFMAMRPPLDIMSTGDEQEPSRVFPKPTSIIPNDIRPTYSWDNQRSF